ncbi:MAG: aminopeptidase [Acidobacteria bacterium]|nr:MAG: aminopeptidase [Acidobacteriota bacterium]
MSDVHTLSRPEEVIVKHLDLDVTVDFESQQISGRTTLEIENLKSVSELYLDTDQLTIESITLGDKKASTAFRLTEPVPYLGRALIIQIQPDTKLVHVHYRTSPNASALQWLTPSQTAGGQHPFLFTQSQAILARTWIPCQDTPAVRFTYRARIRVPDSLIAVMSAESLGKTDDNTFEFRMTQPIPSYLLALAVGDIAFREISGRSGIYAEPSVVDKAAWEFAETEKMIAAAEKLYGPYRWGRYDLIVLPPSFPFGGMENPRLTFATPTVLAGDRSMVSLVAHELAHSWSGNLVTNATWDDFWLNEGFTVYFENRIMEELYGKEYDDMLAVLAFGDLEKEIQDLGSESPDTHLKLNLKSRNPDDAVTNIAYDKGYYLLRTIEEAVGRSKWDAFLRRYFEKFAFHSVTTEDFLAYLRDHLLSGNPDVEDRLKIKQWMYGPGIPDNVVKVYSNRFKQVDEQYKRWVSGTAAGKLETKHWSTHEWVRFIRNMPQKPTPGQMEELDTTFQFSSSGNSEILFEWLMRAIASEYEEAYDSLEKFLVGMGRRKFVRPLFLELAKTESGMELARRIYTKARPGYHPVTVATVDDILKKSSTDEHR